MYVVVHPYPVLEVLISISANSTKDKEVIIERLQNYYPQMEILSERDNTLYVAFPYRNRSELKDLRQELEYAMSGIQNGVQDDEDDDTQNENKQYDAISFNYELRTVNDSCDRFLVTLNPEALMDQEGLRFGSFRGQSFIIPVDGKEVPLGILNKIEYPKATFKLRQETLEQVRKMVNAGELTIVAPDVEDMTGEIEKSIG